MIDCVRTTQRNVKSGPPGRWACGGPPPGCSKPRFRKVIGYLDLAKLVIAIEQHALLIAENNRDRQETREPVTV
jgi:hypothetical protein